MKPAKPIGKTVFVAVGVILIAVVAIIIALNFGDGFMYQNIGILWDKITGQGDLPMQSLVPLQNYFR